MKKLNRRQLRGILQEEYKKLTESNQIDPSHPDYEQAAECIMSSLRQLMRKPMMIQALKMGMEHMVYNDIHTICEEQCSMHDIAHLSDYVCEKVIEKLKTM